MTNGRLMPTVSITYHCEVDGWWAESPEVPGFTAFAASLRELRALTREGVACALDRDTGEVQLLEQDDRGNAVFDVTVTMMPSWPVTGGLPVGSQIGTGTPVRPELQRLPQAQRVAS